MVRHFDELSAGRLSDYIDPDESGDEPSIIGHHEQNIKNLIRSP
ncbi:MAG: hypothetical protein ACE5JL_01360 [Dehalococcoidia bacterium]